jgi:hypothetical protein
MTRPVIYSHESIDPVPRADGADENESSIEHEDSSLPRLQEVAQPDAV